MSSTIGVNESSFGNGPLQISPPAFEGDVGGAVKPSTVLGSIGGIAGGITAISPVLAPLSAPVAAIAGIGSAIAKLFGGGITSAEHDMIMRIYDRVQQRKKKK